VAAGLVVGTISPAVKKQFETESENSQDLDLR
jgi:hypothetical protein